MVNSGVSILNLKKNIINSGYVEADVILTLEMDISALAHQVTNIIKYSQ